MNIESVEPETAFLVTHEGPCGDTYFRYRDDGYWYSRSDHFSVENMPFEGEVKVMMEDTTVTFTEIPMEDYPA